MADPAQRKPGLLPDARHASLAGAGPQRRAARPAAGWPGRRQPRACAVRPHLDGRAGDAGRRPAARSHVHARLRGVRCRRHLRGRHRRHLGQHHRRHGRLHRARRRHPFAARPAIPGCPAFWPGWIDHDRRQRLRFYNKFWGAAITYKAHGWDIGVGNNRGYDQSGLPSLRSSTAGGSYTWGDWKFFAGWHDQRNRHSALLPLYINGWDTQIAPQLAAFGPATGALLRAIFVNNISVNSQIDATSYQVGLHYRYGPGRIMLSVARQNDHTPSDSDATLFALGYNYYLSKRTDIYAVAAFIRNQNEAQYSPAIAGAPGGFTRTPGEDGRAFQLGIRHKF
jgi:hypothetical protein